MAYTVNRDTEFSQELLHLRPIGPQSSIALYHEVQYGGKPLTRQFPADPNEYMVVKAVSGLNVFLDKPPAYIDTFYRNLLRHLALGGIQPYHDFPYVVAQIVDTGWNSTTFYKKRIAITEHSTIEIVPMEGFELIAGMRVRMVCNFIVTTSNQLTLRIVQMLVSNPELAIPAATAAIVRRNPFMESSSEGSEISSDDSTSASDTEADPTEADIAAVTATVTAASASAAQEQAQADELRWKLERFIVASRQAAAHLGIPQYDAAKAAGSVIADSISGTQLARLFNYKPPTDAVAAVDAGASASAALTENKSKAREKEKWQRAACCVCLEQPANHIYIPCMHLAICGECQAKAPQTTCPICRTKSVRVSKVFA